MYMATIVSHVPPLSYTPLSYTPLTHPSRRLTDKGVAYERDRKQC